MGRFNHPIISEHKTGKDGEDLLFVNWRLAYAPLKKEEKYRCFNCNDGYFTHLLKSTTDCKCSLECSKCRKVIPLSDKLPPYPISQHQTGKEGNEILEINWKREYMEQEDHEKFYCLDCFDKHNSKILLQVKSKSSKKGDWMGYGISPSSKCRFYFKCKNCKKKYGLSVPNFTWSYKYRHDLECPNPACNEIGIDGNKGWIYQHNKKFCACRFCKVRFNPNGTSKSSWQGRLIEDKIPDFDFNSDVWYYRQFYDELKPKYKNKKINFSTINPLWYREESKHYLHYLLKSHQYAESTMHGKISSIKNFGRTIANSKVNSKEEITREEILLFIDQLKHSKNRYLNSNLSHIEDFLEFLDLDTSLIRSRDKKKITKNEPDWLDETVRKSIEQHLDKLPAPLARHYKVQMYTACRPSDICSLPFNCLVEKDGKWDINIPLQDKTDRQKLIPATRKIRKVIEQQQQWIRETWGEDFPYLFCHFTGISSQTYPTFPSLRPHPKPPTVETNENPMVIMINMLIKKENILDTNGQKPNFTGGITRPSRLQEVRVKHGLEAAQLLADHKSPNTTFQHYAPPTREEVGAVALPFQELLLNIENKYLAYQSLPESLFENPEDHAVDMEVSPRYTAYGYCSLNKETPCPEELFRQCYGCESFVASVEKLSLYERQYAGEQKRLTEAKEAGAELIELEAKHIIEEMDRWLPQLRKMANEA